MTRKAGSFKSRALKRRQAARPKPEPFTLEKLNKALAATQRADLRAEVRWLIYNGDQLQLYRARRNRRKHAEALRNDPRFAYSERKAGQGSETDRG